MKNISKNKRFYRVLEKNSSKSTIYWEKINEGGESLFFFLHFLYLVIKDHEVTKKYIAGEDIKDEDLSQIDWGVGLTFPK